MRTRRSARAPLAAGLSLCLLALGCASARPRPADEPAPEPRLTLEVGGEVFEDLGEGVARQVVVVVANRGAVPVALLALEARGLGEGTRRLAISDGRAGLRSFGFLPPGESTRHRLGVHFPRPGSGELELSVRYRELPPGTPGRVMEEVVLAAEGPEGRLARTFTAVVAPRDFGRGAAEARTGGIADEAVYSRTLAAWVVRRGNSTWVVEVGETTSFSGLTLEAVRLLDQYEARVPVLDAEGRLQEVPKGPALRVLLESARRDGRRVTVRDYGGEREALHVE